MSAQPWYADGLAFACTRCGNCCTGAPGTVAVSDAECRELAAAVGVEPAEFIARYTRELEDGTRSLTERRNGDCVFWSAREGCQVYAARPRQCRTWPFWRENVASPTAWRSIGRYCPGVDRGERHSLEEIQRNLWP